MRVAADLERLRAFYSQLPASSSLRLALNSCIDAHSASAEWWVKGGYELIVRKRWVILCGWEATVGGDLAEMGAGRFGGRPPDSKQSP